MPNFPSFRHTFPIGKQVGAESYCYSFIAAIPNRSRTIRGADWNDDAHHDTVDDRTWGHRRNITVFFHRDYEKTVISKSMAARFDAGEGDYILISVRHPDCDHEHGIYTKIDKLVSDEKFGVMFLRVSAKDLAKEFKLPKMSKKSPIEVELVSRGGRCYHRDSKVAC